VRVLVLLLGLSLKDLDAAIDLFLELDLKRPSIPKGKEDVEPDKEGREEEGLDEIVEKSGLSSLKHTVSDKLKGPRDDVDSEGVHNGLRALNRVPVRGPEPHTDHDEEEGELRGLCVRPEPVSFSNEEREERLTPATGSRTR